MEFENSFDKFGRMQLSKNDAEFLVHKHFEHVVMTRVQPLQWEFTFGMRVFYCDIEKADELDYLSDYLGEKQQEFLNTKPKRAEKVA